MVAEKIQPYVDIFRKQEVGVGLYHPISRNPRSRTAERAEKLLHSYMKSILPLALKFLARGGGWRELRNAEMLWREEVYSKFLIKRRVSMVFGVCIPEQLVSAARGLGILTVELQHGMVAIDNLKGYWPNEIYPDAFLAWDSESGFLAKQLGLEPIVVGYPMVAYRPQVVENFLGDSICVTLGKGRSPSADPFGCFPLRLYQAVTELLSREVKFFFRIHPGVAFNRPLARRLTSWLNREFPAIEVHNPRHISLIDDLRLSKLHLTFRSAASIEFGLHGILSVECDTDFFTDISRQFSSSNLSSDLVCLYQPGKLNWDSIPYTAEPRCHPRFMGFHLSQEYIREIIEGHRRRVH
jgi:hypothetical protein